MCCLGDKYYIMNVNTKCWFRKGILTSLTSGKNYEFRIDVNDRFFTYIKPFVDNTTVAKTENIYVDMLTITDSDNSFLDEEIFSLDTVIFLEETSGKTTSFNFSIDKVKIKYVTNSKQSYKNGILTLTLYQLQLPPYTEIILNESTR